MRFALGLAALLGGCVQLFSLDSATNVDRDNDSKVDREAGGPDNCDGVYNPDQSDFDTDGDGDACDTCDNGGDVDADADGIPDGCDGCVGNGEDADGDSVPDNCDPCVLVGSDQAEVDVDADGIPDQCDGCIGNGIDRDTDGIPDNCDSCITTNTTDADGDLIPDVCDACPGGGGLDGDGDGVEDACDVCPGGGGIDLDQDGLEDGPDTGCDRCFGPNLDEDSDGLADACDNCPGDPNKEQFDSDGDLVNIPDGVGDVCDVDVMSTNPTRQYFDPFTTAVPDWLVTGGTWVTGPSDLVMDARSASASRTRYTATGAFRIATRLTAYDLGGPFSLFARGANGEELVCAVNKGSLQAIYSGALIGDALLPTDLVFPIPIVLSLDPSGSVRCTFGSITLKPAVQPVYTTWTTGLSGDGTLASFGFFGVVSQN